MHALGMLSHQGLEQDDQGRLPHRFVGSELAQYIQPG